MTSLELIRSRRSIRKFQKYSISTKVITRTLEAGRWAPSGLNNQPWRFTVLDSKQKNALAVYTHYSYIIKNADKLILVFLDKKTSYNYEKDLLAIGACIQNMLLYAHSIKLGTCWLGEILHKRNEINALLGLSKDIQLEAAIALGKPAMVTTKPKRKKLNSLLLKNHGTKT